MNANTALRSQKNEALSQKRSSIKDKIAKLCELEDLKRSAAPAEFAALKVHCRLTEHEIENLKAECREIDGEIQGMMLEENSMWMKLDQNRCNQFFDYHTRTIATYVTSTEKMLKDTKTITAEVTELKRQRTSVSTESGSTSLRSSRKHGEFREDKKAKENEKEKKEGIAVAEKSAERSGSDEKKTENIVKEETTNRAGSKDVAEKINGRDRIASTSEVPSNKSADVEAKKVSSEAGKPFERCENMEVFYDANEEVAPAMLASALKTFQGQKPIADFAGKSSDNIKDAPLKLEEASGVEVLEQSRRKEQRSSSSRFCRMLPGSPGSLIILMDMLGLGAGILMLVVVAAAMGTKAIATD
ncbi:hypothetical protein HDU97_003386 [Phlyctochytrium planicorne]|nr:hypothetical protein HDU97_003386 [Phlyctochytrium planicorne]